MKSNKMVPRIKTGDISITGDANIVGSNNSVQVTKVAVSSDEKLIESAVANFLQKINSDKKVSAKDKGVIVKKAEELKFTLKSASPDLGKIQQFKKFVVEKGGAVAAAGLKLLLEPAIKVIIENATKKILE